MLSVRSHIACAILMLGAVVPLCQGSTAPPGLQVRTVPLTPIKPISPGKTISGGVFNRPLQIASGVSPVVQVQVSHLPDEGTTNFYTIRREGSFSINDPITVSVFTRDEPTFQSFVLQFIDDASQLAPTNCEPLAPPPGLIASNAVGFDPGKVEPRLVTAYAEANLAPKSGGQLRMLTVTSGVPDAIKQRLAAGKSKALLRVVPVGGNANSCLVFPSGTFLATFYDPAKQAPIVFPKPTPPPPSIYAAPTVVSYAPEVMPSFQRCDFIVTGPVNNAKFGAIMDAAHVSKAIGTRFFLCPDVAESLYNGLPASTKAYIAFKDFISFFSSAFNWTAEKFQSVAKAIGTPILGEKYGTILGEALLGQLPGSPLTGDFNTLVDQGCDYVKNKADAKIKDTVKSGESSEITKPTNSAVDQVCSEIKKTLAEQDKVNDFLAHMPEYDPRNASVLLKYTYSAMGSPPAGMVGGGGDQQVTVTATGAGGRNCVGNACGGPREPLYQGQFTLPDMPVGASFTVPVVLSRQPYMQSTNFQSGFVENQKGYLKVDHSAAQPILIYLRQPYPIPANISPPTP